MTKKEGGYDAPVASTYHGYNSSLVDYEYEADDDVPEWVKTRAGVERQMQKEIEAYNANKPKRKMNLGLDYINSRLTERLNLEEQYEAALYKLSHSPD